MASFGVGKQLEQYLAQAEAAAKAAMSDGRYSQQEQERQANDARKAYVAKARGEAQQALLHAAARVEAAEEDYKQEQARAAASYDFARLIAEQTEVASLARTAPSWAAVSEFVSAASGDAHALRAWRTVGLEALLSRSRSENDPLSAERGAVVDVRAQLLAHSEAAEPAKLQEARANLSQALEFQRQVRTEVADVSGWYDSAGVKDFGSGGIFRDLLAELARTLAVQSDAAGRSVTFKQGGGALFG